MHNRLISYHIHNFEVEVYTLVSKGDYLLIFMTEIQAQGTKLQIENMIDYIIYLERIAGVQKRLNILSRMGLGKV
jgi:hypothetical protein